MGLRVVVSAGEVSGDQHLARVIRALLAKQSDVIIRGMAGRECREAGAQLDVDCYKQGAAMGFSELVRSAGGIVASFRKMTSLVTSWQPDVLILVDYPDFNLRLAERAHRHGVRVLYFIPPKVWAWRAGRIERIKRHVDRVAAIFPFEKEFYARRGYADVTYVGHPLAEAKGAQEALPVTRENSLLMLPGSRRFEVEKLLPSMMRVFERLVASGKELTGTVLAAPNMDSSWLRGIAERAVGSGILERIRWSTGDALDEMRRARAGILKSGTCNLEGALAGLPFVSVYSGSIVTRVVVDLFVPLKEFSPVNIIRPGTVKEFMQFKIDEQALETEVRALLWDEGHRSTVTGGLSSVRDALLSSESEAGSISASVAELAIELANRGRRDV
jgi:lipid-A-disaccharide synthase